MNLFNHLSPAALPSILHQCINASTCGFTPVSVPAYLAYGIFLRATTSLKKLFSIRLAAFLAFLIAGGGLFIFGAQPIAVGLFAPPRDKLAHVVTFALIGCAAGAASGSQGWPKVAFCVVGAFVMGIADEVHLPGRSASWVELLADAAGGVAGATLLHFAQLTKARHLRSR